MPDCTTCNIPLFWDMDEDGKMDVCMGGTAGYYLPNRALNYEQISTGIDDPVSPLPPSEFRLFPLYPNPFNGRLTIAYQIPKPLEVSINIFNIEGKEVYSKYENNAFAGRHQFIN